MAKIPDLDSYDVIEISSSAGKDSLAMVTYMAGLLLDRGLLDRAIVIHADMGRADWPGTAELAQAQAEHFGMRSMVVTRPQGDLLDHVKKIGKWPTPSQRYCTSDHKRGQIWVALTALADEVRASWPEDAPKRPVRVLNCVGLRAQESPGRAKAPTFHREKKPSGAKKIVDVWLPIHDWKEDLVWEICNATGAPIHPAYALGLPRASCVFCIYAPEDALKIAGMAMPELLRECVKIEKQINHKFKKNLPLAKVQQDLAEGIGPRGPIKSWRM